MKRSAWRKVWNRLGIVLLTPVAFVITGLSGLSWSSTWRNIKSAWEDA